MATDGYVDRWNQVAYPAAEERRLASVDQMPGPVSAPFSARSGKRVNGAGLVVSASSTGNGSASVTAGAGRIFDSGYASQGAYDFEIPAAIGPIALGVRPSVGQSRIDLVVARIYDADLSVGVVREIKVEVVPGSAGTTPAPPTLPALSVLLGTLTVPASGTISVTQNAPKTVSAGGILPVATTAERDQLVTDGIAYAGLVVFNAQTGQVETYTGTLWDYDGRWQTYTPTLTNFPADSTVTARYTRVGKMVTVRFGITFGSGAVGAGNLLISPPTTMVESPTGTTYRDVLGSCSMVDSSAGGNARRTGVVMFGNATNRVAFMGPNSDGIAQIATNTVPFTWAATDTLSGTFTYEEA